METDTVNTFSNSINFAFSAAYGPDAPPLRMNSVCRGDRAAEEEEAFL